MLVLHKFFLFSLLGLLFVQGTTNTKQELNDQLFEAVRKGDAAAVAALLDKGADVNAKFRYGQTALFKAAEKGNASVAKVLLDRGADVTVKDTFYGATAMTWAMSNGHTDVVRLLFEKDSSNADEVLMTGVRSSNEELAKVFCGRSAVRGTATPSRRASATSNSLSSAMRKKGLLMTWVPEAAASFSHAW